MFARYGVKDEVLGGTAVYRMISNRPNIVLFKRW